MVNLKKLHLDTSYFVFSLLMSFLAIITVIDDLDADVRFHIVS